MAEESSAGVKRRRRTEIGVNAWDGCEPKPSVADFYPASRRMRDRGLGIAILVTACLGAAGLPAWPGRRTRRPWRTTWVPVWPESSTTAGPATCPAEEGADSADERPHNPFGKRLKAVRSELKKAGKPSGIPARIEAIADEDSDGDGVPNLLELVTGHFPGEADDQPAAAELAKGRAAIAALEAGASGYRLESVRASRASGASRRPIPGLGRKTRSMPSSPPSTNHAA